MVVTTPSFWAAKWDCQMAPFLWLNTPHCPMEITPFRASVCPMGVADTLELSRVLTVLEFCHNCQKYDFQLYKFWFSFIISILMRSIIIDLFWIINNFLLQCAQYLFAPSLMAFQNIKISLDTVNKHFKIYLSLTCKIFSAACTSNGSLIEWRIALFHKKCSW